MFPRVYLKFYHEQKSLLKKDYIYCMKEESLVILRRKHLSAKRLHIGREMNIWPGSS